MYADQIELAFGFHVLTPDEDTMSTPRDSQRLYGALADEDDGDQGEFLANPINRAQAAASALIAHFTDQLHAARFREVEQSACEFLQQLDAQEDIAAEAAELGEDATPEARALMAYLHTRTLEYETRMAIRVVCRCALRASKAARGGGSWGLILGR